MKGLFGIASLLLALVIVGLLIKQQLGANRMATPVLTPAASSSSAAGADAAPVTVRQQAAQTQQQYKQALEAAMAQPRAEPDQK